MTHETALAHVESGDFTAALDTARLARDRHAGHPGEISLTIAWIHLEQGRPRACARELAEAGRLGAPPARVRCLHGLRLCADGAYPQASAELSAALDDLADDPRWLANALVGRGIAEGYLLRLRQADRDFAEAAGVLAGLGERERVATCLHNRGFVALQAGDLPAALALFDSAIQGGLRSGRAEALVDRASALLAAGMSRDATAVLRHAESLLAGAGRQSRLAEATLTAGYCALRSGDTASAAVSARRARDLFRAQRRPGWAASADALLLRVGPPDVPAARRVAKRLLRSGRRMEAAELLVDTAKGAPAVDARRLLSSVQGERYASTARLRAIGWLARAKLATDNRALSAACRAGLRVVDEYAAAMGSWEMRAGAAELGSDLAGTALGAALRGGRPRAVLMWAERRRAARITVNSVRPPVDPTLAETLVELRTAEPDRAAELEHEVRRLSLLARGGTAAHLEHRLADLTAALREWVLVSYTGHEGQLVACTVADGRVRLHGLGRDDVRSCATALRHGVSSAANTVDDKLMRPLSRVVADRPLVVVPAENMSGLVWAALPSCVGRPVSVAPSAGTWLRAGEAAPGSGSVWISGPGLRHAEREVRSLCDGGTVLIRPTAETALSAMDSAELVHVAAHGRFRADAPLFSSVELGDGPLYGYDLDRLCRAPRLLVLSACEAGRGEALAGVVLSRGGQAVVASLTRVPDERAVDLVAAFHARLRAGLGPAAALAAAQAQHGHLGFVCFGAG